MPCYTAIGDQMSDNKKKRYLKKREKISVLIDKLEGNYDLPEHPKAMNGYSNKNEIIEKIMAECGWSKPSTV